MLSLERRAPLSSLVGREVRALLGAPSTWLAFAMSSVLVGLSLPGVGALPAVGVYADVVLEEVFSAASASLALLFPFVVGRGLARDRESGADALLAQLGHGALSTMVSRTLALVVGAVLLLVPAAAALAALSGRGAGVDIAVVGAGLLGHMLFALVVIGVGACAAGLVSSVAAARFATFIVVAAMWFHERAGGKGAAFLPGAAVHVFERGVLDARDTLVLFAGAIGLTLAGAWLAWPAPVEKRALRAALAVVGLVVASLGASQLRASLDVSVDQRNSLASAAVSALALVGDPIRVTLRMRADDPRAVYLQREVITPMARAADVRVRYVPEFEDDVEWRVGANVFTSTATSAAEIVPRVLELAGVKAPSVVDTRPARRPGGGRRTAALALALCLGVWPIVGVAGIVVTRRRRS